jgi:hypothetical protein
MVTQGDHYILTTHEFDTVESVRKQLRSDAPLTVEARRDLADLLQLVIARATFAKGSPLNKFYVKRWPHERP